MEDKDPQAACLPGAGDKAFCIFIGRWAANMYSVAYRLTGSHADAEDVLQQTLLKAWQGVASVRDPNRLEAWLYRVLINEARTHYRIKNRWRLEGSDRVKEGAVSQLRNEAENEVKEEMRQRLKQALNRLDAKHREVLVLHDIQNLSHETIAGALGTSTGTVWSRLHYARKKMKELIGS